MKYSKPQTPALGFLTKNKSKSILSFNSDFKVFRTIYNEWKTTLDKLKTTYNKLKSIHNKSKTTLNELKTIYNESKTTYSKLKTIHDESRYRAERCMS